MSANKLSPLSKSIVILLFLEGLFGFFVKLNGYSTYRKERKQKSIIRGFVFHFHGFMGTILLVLSVFDWIFSRFDTKLERIKSSVGLSSILISFFSGISTIFLGGIKYTISTSVMGLGFFAAIISYILRSR